MVDYATVARLAQHFAGAALDPHGWLPALGALASATRSTHGELVLVGTPRSGLAESWISGGDPVDRDMFMAAGGYDPRANPRIAASQRSTPLQVVHETHYDAVEPLLDGDSVLTIFEDSRIEAGCQAALIQEAQLLVGLAVLRGGREGRTADGDRAMFAAVAPYARDAAQVHLGLERQSAALLAGAFEAMAAAAFLLDSSGRVIARTPAAERLLSRGRLRLVDGRLCGQRGAEAAALARVIDARLSPGDTPTLLATVALRGEGGDPMLLADVSAMPRREWSFGVAPRVLVLVRGGALRRESAATLLQQTWDLSTAEADVVMRIADGQARTTIATARGVSVETVRAQLKSIFAKAGVTREAELAARAATLTAGSW